MILLAAATMVLDHLKYIYGPDILFSLPGRFAAVYFLYSCGVGLSKTSSHKNYFYRLIVCATVTQCIFMLSGFGSNLNVVFTMALVAFMLWTDLFPLFL